ncbi:MAG: ribonuclease Y, partial [Proteiniclasticum sp.]|nr:ribonuclease Y [Proteiniclasticum sp.]
MSTEQIAIIVTGVVTLLVVGAIILYLSNSKLKTAKEILGNAETDSKRILEDSKKDAEALKKEAALEAKDEAFKLKSEAEKEVRERRSEVQRLERRTIQKEESLDKKMEQLEKKEENLAKKVQDLTLKETEAEELLSKRREELERIASLSQEDAKQLLMSEVRGEVQRDLTMMVKEMETKAKEEADKKAREIITTSIQRCAADHVSETTVHVVSLPNDEMKGRIIGREGRNIRTLETLTGVDLIIDDTPEAVILSSFDPIRREVAKLTLEKLIVDGRIHPARIEEMVDKSKKDVENSIKEEGEQASFEIGIHGIHPELLKLLGRLKFRTSYGQNVLKHSIEVANLAGLMASELGLDVTLAKRAGLLHDIGKAVDHEVEGPHALIGA